MRVSTLHALAYVSIRQHTSAYVRSTGIPLSRQQQCASRRCKGQACSCATACCSCVLQLRVAAACCSCVLQPSRRSSASSTTARLPAGPHIAYMCLTRKHAHSIHIAYYMRLARRHTYLCPHTPICVLILLPSVSSYHYTAAKLPLDVIVCERVYAVVVHNTYVCKRGIIKKKCLKKNDK
jgi:hypothetical protein